MNSMFDNRRELLKTGLAAVANWKTDKELVAWARSQHLYLYICRENHHAKEDRSIWHNLFKSGHTEEIMASYRHYLLSNETLMARIPELQGKLLVCWCYPKPCHGDILAALANGSDGISSLLRPH
ncbi:MAG: hypothetical protein QG663_1664 [Thermodesulfobacteriota bacterium]|nr:hypothetical protein [Thermodesulfobacteriota bacterium]